MGRAAGIVWSGTVNFSTVRPAIAHLSARAQLRPWPRRDAIAHLVLLDVEMVPTSDDIRGWIADVETGRHAHAATHHFTSIRTGALFPRAAEVFRAHGFVEVDRLALLERPLLDAPGRRPAAPAGTTFRRLRERDLADAAAIDAQAFGDEWSNDATSLAEIIDATPQARRRLVTGTVDDAPTPSTTEPDSDTTADAPGHPTVEPDCDTATHPPTDAPTHERSGSTHRQGGSTHERSGSTHERGGSTQERGGAATRSAIGFSITGRAGSAAYLQRLAVDPRARRRGVARQLVDDACRWATRRGATRILVNTGVDNDAALALYDQTGFRRAPDELVVLQLDDLR